MKIKFIILVFLSLFLFSCSEKPEKPNIKVWDIEVSGNKVKIWESFEVTWEKVKLWDSLEVTWDKVKVWESLEVTWNSVKAWWVNISF